MVVRPGAEAERGPVPRRRAGRRALRQRVTDEAGRHPASLVEALLEREDAQHAVHDARDALRRPRRHAQTLGET